MKKVQTFFLSTLLLVLTLTLSSFHSEWSREENRVEERAEKQKKRSWRILPKALKKKRAERKSLRLQKRERRQAARFDCDIIMFRDRQEVHARILEVGTSTIRYEDCYGTDGYVYSARPDEVSYIEYKDGSRVSFDGNNNNNNQNQNKGSRQVGDKSFIATALLWFFLGIFPAVHRFYLGHIGMGVLYLLTFSLCGIGWIIDGVLLFTGGLLPRNGSYYDYNDVF